VTSLEVMQVLRAIQEREHVTVVIITHEHDIAEMTDRVVHLVDGNIAGDALRAGRHAPHAEPITAVSGPPAPAPAAP
jgi:putative ABC transport system ATP-binding protein